MRGRGCSGSVASARSALSVNSTSPTLWGPALHRSRRVHGSGSRSPVRQVPVSLGQRPPLHIVKLILRLRALGDHTLLLPFQPELM
jgi:hypothetical protein